jgi:PKD repeat protein
MNRNVLILSIIILLVAGGIFLWKVFGGEDCAEPQASVSSTSLRIGEPMEFEDHSEGAQSWEWDFGDGDVQTVLKGTKTFGRSGSYQVVLTIDGKCQKTFDITVNSIEEPVFYIDPSDPKPGESFTYADSTTGATAWKWDFGNGKTSSTRSGTMTYAAAGDYTVRLEVNGGTYLGSKEITVFESKPDPMTMPKPLIRASKAQVEIGEEVVFTDVTPQAEGSKWKFGESGAVDATGPSVTYRYASAGTYTVVLTNSKRPGQQGRTIIRVKGPKNPCGNMVTLPPDNFILGVFKALATPDNKMETIAQARGRLKLWTCNDMSTPVKVGSEEIDLGSYINKLDIIHPTLLDLKTERANSRIIRFIVIEQ